MIDTKTKEYIIKKLNELYLKQMYEDKKNKKTTYVAKEDCYSDLIDFFEKNL